MAATALSVFITGADGGLGAAFLGEFARRGWRVFGGCLNETSLSTRDGLTRVPLDVRSEASAHEAARLVSERTGSIELLINNAGINPDKDIPLEQLDIALSAQSIDVNALGPLRVTQAFLPLLEKGSLKRIVNISSEAGSIAQCYRTSWFGYSMSKAALNIQTRILQNYLGPRGFSVLSVHPGWMRSGMGAANATYDPSQSAASICDTITASRDSQSPMFVQWDGAALPW